MTNYSFSGWRRSSGLNPRFDNDALLVTNFINLKIKSAQSFRYAHKVRVYIHVSIRMSASACMSIYIYTMFLNKNTIIYFSPNISVLLCNQH
jgi:hypothetical protein